MQEQADTLIFELIQQMTTTTISTLETVVGCACKAEDDNPWQT